MDGFSGQMPFLLLMLVVFFFFIILPQQRRQKKEKNFMRDLSKGDRVITKSGLHAKVLDLNDNDNTCIIETMAGKLKIERSALSLEMSQKLNLLKNNIIPLRRVFFTYFMYRYLIRPILFLGDPEWIHYFTFSLIKLINKIPGISKFIRLLYEVNHPKLERYLELSLKTHWTGGWF